MAALSHRTFIEKSTLVQEKFAGRKVIACMIMKLDYEDAGTAVALGTGKHVVCISYLRPKTHQSIGNIP